MDGLTLEVNLTVTIITTIIIIAVSYILERRGYCFKIGGVDRETSIFIVILGFLLGFATMLAYILYSLGFRSKEYVINAVNSIIGEGLSFFDVGNSIIFNALLIGLLLYCGLAFILSHPNTNERTEMTRARAIITVVFAYTIFGFCVGNITTAINNLLEAILLCIIACYNINWNREMKRFKISFGFNVSKSILFIAMYNASVIVNAVIVQNLL